MCRKQYTVLSVACKLAAKTLRDTRRCCVGLAKASRSLTRLCKIFWKCSELIMYWTFRTVSRDMIVLIQKLAAASNAHTSRLELTR